MEGIASTSTSKQLVAEDHIEDGHQSSDDEPMVDPATGQKILRPRNAWILYRKTRLDDVPPLSDGSRAPMAKASSIISSWWKNETKDVKKKFELMAAAEKAEHKRRYPDYKYKPRTSHQIAKAKEKKRAATKKAQQVKEKERVKVKQQTPPPPLASSVHTSYIAAAIANQAALQSLQSASHGPDGPSPPLSLASTPITTPSPLPLSDFEQGSSSTAATTQPTSPGDVLGLSLAPSAFNFKDQKSPLRAPRHVPARIPPRARGARLVSIATNDTGSRVPSSSSLAIPSPASSTPASLSPLAWPLPSHHPSPESGNDSLSADLIPPTSADLSWGDDSGSLNAEGSGSVSIDLEFNANADTEFFGNLEYFDSMGLPPMDNNDGVFHFPADLFLDAAPGQIDVNLPNFESSEHDRDRFASLLNDFDFSAYQADQMNFSQDGPSEIPGMPDTGPWTNWEGAQDSASVATNMDMFSGDVSAQSQQIMMPQVSASSEYSSEPQGHTAMEDQQSEGVPVQSQLMIPSQETQQVMPPMPFSADVLSDPDFQAMFARYLDQKQKQSQQQQPAHHQQQQQQPANEYTQQQQQQQPVAQYTQQASQEQMHQPQPHYAPQPLQPQEQQYQSQYMQQQPQQMHYEGYQYMEQPQQIQQQQHSSAPMHSMSPASTSSEPSTPAANSIPQQNTRYVPPTGAMHARARRVAGSWKAPPVKHEAWCHAYAKL